jgi:hypothetical protein
MSLGASISLGSGCHLERDETESGTREPDWESATNTAIAGTSLTGWPTPSRHIYCRGRYSTLKSTLKFMLKSMLKSMLKCTLKSYFCENCYFAKSLFREIAISQSLFRENCYFTIAKKLQQCRFTWSFVGLAPALRGRSSPICKKIQELFIIVNCQAYIRLKCLLFEELFTSEMFMDFFANWGQSTPRGRGLSYQIWGKLAWTL